MLEHREGSKMDRRTLVAGLLAAVVISCSGPAREAVGAMVQDAGEAMAGAGRGMAGPGAGMQNDPGSMPNTPDGMLVDAGKMLEDAGTMLHDAGAALGGQGGSSSDASAQAPTEPTVIDGACDVESGRRVTGPTGPTSSSLFSQLYAEVDIGTRTAKELAGATFIMCDYEAMGPAAAPATCPADATCENVGTYPRPQSDCTVYSFFELRGSKAIASCGSRNEVTVGGTTTVSGGRWRTVQFVIL